MSDGRTIPDDIATRVSRLINAAEDMRQHASDDLKQIYADLRDDLKGLGWAGSSISSEVAALKGAIVEMRLDDEKKSKRDEKSERIDDYVSMLSRARAREGRSYAEATGRAESVQPKAVGDEYAGTSSDKNPAPINSFLGPHSQEVDDGQPHPSSNAGGAKRDGAQTIVGRADGRSGLSITQLEQQDASASQDRNEPISESEATVTHSDTTLATSPDASRKAGEGSILPLSPAAHSDDDVPDFLKRDTAPARKTAADFRPNCLRPDVCASSGLHHCYQCGKASETMEGELA